MRYLAVVLVVVGIVGVARADEKALKPYAGKVVLSTDTPPIGFDDLPAFLKANVSKDGVYELLKWDVSFVGVLAKPVDKVSLVIANPADKDPIVTMELTPTRLVVLGHFTPTKAAGFAEGTHYSVTLVADKKTLAKSELVLRH
jgi:hypothetical protein